jgi:hypothetical protein
VKRFSVFIGQSLCGPGVQWWLDTGDAVTVDGREMVRLPGGTIVTAEGWHDTVHAAVAAAAERLDSIAASVAGQAGILRSAANSFEMVARLREVARG